VSVWTGASKRIFWNSNPIAHLSHRKGQLPLVNANPDNGSLARRSAGETIQVTTNYCSFTYSALACFRMGMSGSASFQSARKS